MAIHTIAIVGAGAWGTALAQTAARAGREVALVTRDPAVAEALRQGHVDPRRLSGVVLDPLIRATTDVRETAAADAVLLAVPAQTVRNVCKSLAAARTLVVCAKGFETATGARLSEVVAQECPQSARAVLSGPNFAGEVARGLPAATTLGCADAALGRDLAEALSSGSFRAYWSEDVIGVEVGGALKNVLAIAAGIVAGRGLGENARAAIVTRGLAELARLGEALGGRRETLMGLSGLGDLVLTAGSLTSRNMAFGHAIGAGADPQTLRRQPGPLVEGVFSAAAVARLAAAHGVEMPIAAAVDAILEGRLDIDQALDQLMRRPIKAEEPG